MAWWRRSISWNDYAGIDVKGKTVVILINDPGNEDANPDPKFFKGKAMTYYGRWTYKYEEAARHGAAAAIIVHETIPAAYGWQVVRNFQLRLQAVAGGQGQEQVHVADPGLDHARYRQDFVHARRAWITTALKAAANKPGFKPVALTGESARASAPTPRFSI